MTLQVYAASARWRFSLSGSAPTAYLTGYNVLPTIGTLFLLNAISAGVVGFGLLLPIERLFGERFVGSLALGAVAIAIGSLIALFISETSVLFGFSEDGYDTPVVIAIASEVATVVLLAPVAVAKAVRIVTRRPALAE